MKQFIEIYPLKSTKVADFDAVPVVTELLGWVNGTILIKGYDRITTSGFSVFSTPSYHEEECLMAVVELDGEFQGIEHFRCKLIKED